MTDQAAPPPPPGTPKRSLWQWITGKEPEPTPEEGAPTQAPVEEPSFFERLAGRGPYMQKIRKIRQEEHAAYQKQQEYYRRDLQKQRYDTQKQLMYQQQHIYGASGYNLRRYDDRLRRVARSGSDEALDRAQREAERVEKKAAEKYERIERHTLKDQRLGEREYLRSLQKQRDDRIRSRIEQLRLETRQQTFHSSPDSALGSSRTGSSRLTPQQRRNPGTSGRLPSR